MKNLQQLTKEINEITLLIEEKYPELYKYLDENPVTIPTAPHPSLDTRNFSDYLDSLRELLIHHLESHLNT